MTTFHSWDEVKGEGFDAEDLDVIAAGASRGGSWCPEELMERREWEFWWD
ncbi:hypothetical protein [Streptomyces sp. NPDC002156]